MQDIRNLFDIKSIRWKIEKHTLERIGHILRMKNERTVKVALLGWLNSLENIKKRPGYKGNFFQLEEAYERGGDKLE